MSITEKKAIAAMIAISAAMLPLSPATAQDAGEDEAGDHIIDLSRDVERGDGAPRLGPPTERRSLPPAPESLETDEERIPGVLVILAHPDDEITIAPVLSRIAREGGSVTVVFATSGDAGPGVSDLQPGRELAELREEEARCSAFALGLPEPIFWQLGDGTLGQMARSPDSAARDMGGRIASLIAIEKPRIIMTWGPDGGYGHSDHRMVSNAVTQVVQAMGDDRPELLYAALPDGSQADIPGFDRWATVHPTLITDRIRYEMADLEAARFAIDCYQSQFAPDQRAALPSLLHSRIWQGTVYFRLAFAVAR